MLGCILVQYTVGLHIVFQDFGKGSFVLLLDTFRPPCHPWHTLQKKKQDDSSPHTSLFFSSPHHQPVHTRFCHRTTTLTRVLLPRCFYCSPSLKRKCDPVCQCETPQPLAPAPLLISVSSSILLLPVDTFLVLHLVTTVRATPSTIGPPYWDSSR